MQNPGRLDTNDLSSNITNPSPRSLDEFPLHMERPVDDDSSQISLVPQGSDEVVISDNKKRTDPFQFGQRYLTSDADVFSYNAWDHVEPDSEYHNYAESQYNLQRSNPVSDYDKGRINSAPQKWWDTFYRHKSATFFKDRKWLFQEFPVLHEVSRKEAGRKRVLEVGAGAGNTAFPILRLNENPELEVFAYDFSKIAVETMRGSADYAMRERDDGEASALGSIKCEVWDLASSGAETGSTLPPGIESESIDVVILIFTFSALSPPQWEQAVSNVWNVLKPGGVLLFRDYGRGDLAQVRFKAGRWMEENFYVRGDGTRVYFFEKDEIAKIFRGDGGGKHCFETVHLDVDRRLIVNRQRRIKMYRCWLQGLFRKPPS